MHGRALYVNVRGSVHWGQNFCLAMCLTIVSISIGLQCSTISALYKVWAGKRLELVTLQDIVCIMHNVDMYYLVGPHV